MLKYFTLFLTLFFSLNTSYTSEYKERYIPIYNEANILEKKQHFFDFFLPIIQKVNNEISAQRQFILILKDKAKPLSIKNKDRLEKLAKQYREDPKQHTVTLITSLLIKINPIPNSLALAQAANESAWGRSRFAQEGNNFFGQWCFTKGCGLIPSDRSENQQHQVKKFNSPYDSVKSYINNLNGHPSYQVLRNLRADSLQKNITPTGYLLANGLIPYSEKGQSYVKEIQSIIQYNKLE